MESVKEEQVLFEARFCRPLSKRGRNKGNNSFINSPYIPCLAAAVEEEEEGKCTEIPKKKAQVRVWQPLFVSVYISIY
jgi:hypothetical protein